MVPNMSLTPRGVDKTKRYGWTIADKPGQFMYIPKTRLQLDVADHNAHGGYQRDPGSRKGTAKVLRIAREWSWPACAALIVARRPDETFYIIDGGHRHAAAMRRSDIVDLPCLVFDVDLLEQEAIAHIRINKNRKVQSGSEQWRAAVSSKDKTAMRIQELVEASGRIVAESGSSRTIRCIGVIRQLFDRSPNEMEALWSLFVELFEGKSWNSRVMTALVWVERNAVGDSLTSPFWRRKVLDRGSESLLDSCLKMAGVAGKGGDRVWGEGALKKINAGQQKHIFKVKV